MHKTFIHTWHDAILYLLIDVFGTFEALEEIGITTIHENCNGFDRLQIAQRHAICEIYEIGRTIIHDIVKRIGEVSNGV